MTASASVLWNSHVSSPTGWMYLAGNRNPYLHNNNNNDISTSCPPVLLSSYLPVSLSSMEKEKVELATPRAQSEAPPLAT